MSAEQAARKTIDELLGKAGWRVCDLKDADLHASRGVAIREFPLEPPSPARAEAGRGEGGYADYLLYVDGKAAGVVEAKKVGATLTGVEVQSGRYAQGLPASLPAWTRPLPFVYESTGVETHFTNGLDPEPRARNVFAFHRPETLAGWLGGSGFSPTPASSRPEGRPTDGTADASAGYALGTFLARVRRMPELVTAWGDHKLWPAQITAIRNSAQRQEPPTTLVFAKEHVDAEVNACTVREKFNRDDEFAQLISYRTAGARPGQPIMSLRVSYYSPRIALTGGMFAAGTAIVQAEFVVFVRSVRSHSSFEQVKGCGVRVKRFDHLHWCRSAACGHFASIAVSEQVRPACPRRQMHRRTFDVQGLNGEVSITCS